MSGYLSLFLYVLMKARKSIYRHVLGHPGDSTPDEWDPLVLLVGSPLTFLGTPTPKFLLEERNTGGTKKRDRSLRPG